MIGQVGQLVLALEEQLVSGLGWVHKSVPEFMEYDKEMVYRPYGKKFH